MSAMLVKYLKLMSIIAQAAGYGPEDTKSQIEGCARLKHQARKFLTMTAACGQ